MFGSKSFGLEEVANQAAIIINENINDKIDLINIKYAEEDQSFSTQMGRVYAPCNLEYVQSNNIQIGEPDSLVEEVYNIEDKFPSINIIATSARDNEKGGDHATNFDIPLNIECWVKASPSEGSSYAYRRACRITEAVNLCLVENANLNGLIMKLSKTPQMAVSPIITKDLVIPGANLDNTFYKTQEENFNGYYLCGGGLIYNIQKNSAF